MSEAVPAAVTVVDHPERMRYEMQVDDRLAGFVQYRRHDGRLVFTHTEIDDAFEGQGLGSELARAALDDARGRLTVTPSGIDGPVVIATGHPVCDTRCAGGTRRSSH